MMPAGSGGGGPSLSAHASASAAISGRRASRAPRTNSAIVKMPGRHVHALSPAAAAAAAAVAAVGAAAVAGAGVGVGGWPIIRCISCSIGLCIWASASSRNTLAAAQGVRVRVRSE